MKTWSILVIVLLVGLLVGLDVGILIEQNRYIPTTSITTTDFKSFVTKELTACEKDIPRSEHCALSWKVRRILVLPNE
jgi:hypothetical protein